MLLYDYTGASAMDLNCLLNSGRPSADHCTEGVPCLHDSKRLPYALPEPLWLHHNKGQGMCMPEVMKRDVPLMVYVPAWGEPHIAFTARNSSKTASPQLSHVTEMSIRALLRDVPGRFPVDGLRSSAGRRPAHRLHRSGTCLRCRCRKSRRARGCCRGAPALASRPAPAVHMESGFRWPDAASCFEHAQHTMLRAALP